MSIDTNALETLRHEHEVAHELLSRLKRMGEEIRDGVAVAPRDVRFGVGLLDAYLHRVHARQFDVELWPEAAHVAPSECRVPLEMVRTRHAQMRETAQSVLRLTRRWMDGDATVAEDVAEGLLRLARADEAMNGFEESHPFPCLSTAMPSGTHERLRATFAGHRGTKSALEANITRFLAGRPSSR